MKKIQKLILLSVILIGGISASTFTLKADVIDPVFEDDGNLCPEVGCTCIVVHG